MLSVREALWDHFPGREPPICEVPGFSALGSDILKRKVIIIPDNLIG